MNRRRATTGVVWYLGTIQYCAFLFIGGAGWFLVAQLTGFFGDDLLIRIAACLLLVGLIAVESWWAHMPGFDDELRDFAVDLLTSAAIAGFGMAVVAVIFTGLLVK